MYGNLKFGVFNFVLLFGCSFIVEVNAQTTAPPAAPPATSFGSIPKKAAPPKAKSAPKPSGPITTSSKTGKLTKPKMAERGEKILNVYKPMNLRKLPLEKRAYKVFGKYFKREWQKTKIFKKGARYRGELPLYKTGIKCLNDHVLIFDFHELKISHPAYQKENSRIKTYAKGQGIKKSKSGAHLYGVYLYKSKTKSLKKLYSSHVERWVGSKRIVGTKLEFCPNLLLEESTLLVDEVTGHPVYEYKWLVYDGSRYSEIIGEKESPPEEGDSDVE